MLKGCACLEGREGPKATQLVAGGAGIRRQILGSGLGPFQKKLQDAADLLLELEQKTVSFLYL